MDNRLTILTANVNSVKQRETELKPMINKHSPDVICLQETKMKTKWKLDGYFEANALPSGLHNAPKGVKIMIKTDIEYEKVSLLSKDTRRLEFTAIDIYLPHKQELRLIDTYISPNIAGKDNQQSVYEEIKTAVKSKPVSLSIGDHNSKLDLPQHNNTNPLGDVLEEYRQNGELFVYAPTEYTRYDPAGRQPSTIDLAVTTPRNSNLISEVIVLDDIGTDHRPVLFYTTLTKKPTSTREVRPNFDKADWRTYRDILIAMMTLAPEISPIKASIDAAIDFLTKIIQKADLEAIPRSRNNSSGQRELPREIVDLIDEKKHLRNEIHRGRKEHKPRVNRLGKEIKRMIKDFVEKCHQKKWENCGNKTSNGFYKLARSYLNPGVKTTTYPLKDANGKRIGSDEEKLAAFKNLYDDIFSPPEVDEKSRATYVEANAYFTSIRDKYQEVRLRPEAHDLNQVVTPKHIIQVLKNVKNTSPGEDGIYYIHVRNLPEVALLYLAKIYETSWRCAYSPDRWKQTCMILKPKPGKDLSDPKNYRPLTSAPVLGKVNEKVVNSELKCYLEVNDLLPESQAGFRNKRSTQDQLLKLIQEVRRNFQLGRVTMATFFDVNKAFDKMTHDGVALKMKRMGLSEVTIALLVNFLTGRTTKIKLNGIYSDPILQKAGTPQGAILSPTLFNIWVSDLPQPQDKQVSISQFADDTGSWAYSDKDNPIQARNKLQKYNNLLIEWCEKWCILLSPQKTQLIVFCKKDPPNKSALYQIINGEKIKPTDQVRFLGMELDQKLTLRDDHKKRMTEAKRRTALFAAITGTSQKPRASSDISLKILHAMIEPLFYYAPTVSCVKGKGMFKDQDTILRKAAKLAIHCPRSVRNEYVVEKANLEESQVKTVEMARSYVLNPIRSQSVQNLVTNYSQSRSNKYKLKTPLDIILPKI